MCIRDRGNYITLTGKADRIDPVFRTLQVGETVVPFEDLVEISGESLSLIHILFFFSPMPLPAETTRSACGMGVSIGMPTEKS